MRITHLLILLLSFRKPIITPAQLVERQPQGTWPDWNLGDLFWDGVSVFRGIGDLFQDPSGSDSSKTKPPPDTDSPEAAPTSPPSATLSPDEPVYKIKTNNDPSSPPELGADLPLVQPSVNEECDFINVSLPTYNSSNLPFNA